MTRTTNRTAIGLALFALLALAAPALPSVAEAQPRARSAQRSGTTRGRTRSRSRSRASSRDSSRGSWRDRGGPRGRRGVRRTRRVRVRVRPGFDARRCDTYDGVYCGYDDVYYDYSGGGGTGLGFGLSLGPTASLYYGGNNGLSSARVLGSDIDPGLLAPFGADLRAWFVFDRFRGGISVQGGGVFANGSTSLRAEDAFEAGSRVEDGGWFGIHAIAAYQPQLDDVVQLWLGGRLGAFVLTLPIESNERRYASVGRVAVSGGPELGVRFSFGPVGVMVWGFADVLQPGVGQLSVAFVMELPKPEGAAY